MINRLSNFFTIILFLVISLGILEFTSRLLYKNITLPGGQKAVEILLGEHSLCEYSMFMPHAYMLYVNRPLWKDEHFEQNNSLGYRGKEFSQDPAPNKVRILTLGGSTTYEYPAVIDPSQTWTAKLESLLKKKGIASETINGGLNGATSAEILSQYTYKHRYLRSNLVILNVGWNDAMPLLFSHYEPSYGSYRGWGSSPINLRSGEKILLQSSFIKVLYTWWLGNPKLSDLLMFPAEYNSISRKQAQENLKHNEPVGFERNVDLLVRNIIADGATPIFFIEPVASANIFKRYRDSWVESVYPVLLAAYDKDKLVIKNIANKYHLQIIEMPQGAIPLEDFVDHAHVNPHGADLKAEYIANHGNFILSREKNL